jgi:hypothetical protein
LRSKSGSPTVLTDNFVLRAGSLSVATVDFHSDAVFSTDASYVIERVEMLTHQLRAVRVKVDDEYTEERYARRGLDWGATPPFTAGVVRAEDTYYLPQWGVGAHCSTDRLPLESAFPFLVRWATSQFTFSLARRLHVRHYRDDTVTILSGESGTDAFGNVRGYRYAYTVTYPGACRITCVMWRTGKLCCDAPAHIVPRPGRLGFPRGHGVPEPLPQSHAARRAEARFAHC